MVGWDQYIIMTYKKGTCLITVEQIEGFGKNPGLWIGSTEKNELLKVASFGSQEKADMFCKSLDIFLGLNPSEDDVCECWHSNNHGGAECWGTKERESCNCEGNKSRCDFYPEYWKDKKNG